MYRTVEVLARCNVEDPPPNGQVYGPITLPVELEQGLGGVGLEDDGGRPAREDDWWLRAEVEVDQDDEEGEEDQVDGRGD